MTTPRGEARAEAQPTKPVILIAAAPAEVMLRNQLLSRYRTDYELVFGEPAAALGVLDELAEAGRAVALVLVSRSPHVRSVLGAVRRLHPHARRGLLVAWNEQRPAREEMSEIISRGQADCWVRRPMSSPDERFHRDVVELLDEWWRHRGTSFEAVTVIGQRQSARAHEICDLLQRHDFPYGSYDADSPAGSKALTRAGVTAERLPVVVLHDGTVLVDPTNVDAANALGARTRPREGVYDVAIVGAGPAGLAAAVYAGSEGLRTALIERQSMGGQAGTSSLIRNYLGFPRGISGAELAARALDQAMIFGTDMVYGGDASGLSIAGDRRTLHLADGTAISARSVIVATGIAYRQLDNPDLRAFQGLGVFYGAAMSEARALTGEHVYVVGGGNSAGQAAIHLAKFAKHVTIAIRSDSLAQSMSDYLIQDISRTQNIDVRYGVEVVGASGDGWLEKLTLRRTIDRREETVAAAGLFVLIGAQPYTDWLPESVHRDEHGYLITGPACTCGSCPTGDRRLFETSLPGVFAVGDVRHQSNKRVASAVGEGSVAIRMVHEYLTRRLGKTAEAGRSLTPVL
ncbi:MAG: thioredoxin reductase [Frankiaceae bacterium]|nr:thioredoxin reductase [Frankiaceae bacterium]